MSNISEQLEVYGLNEDTYKMCIADIDAKLNGENDLDWSEIKDKYNIQCAADTIRKSSSTIFGGKFRSDFYRANNFSYSEHEYDLDHKLEELRKERMKLQTVNLERNRIDRNEARQELFYEYVGEANESLPWPEFKPLHRDDTGEIQYCLTIADIHYGAKFTSTNNEYSPEIAKERFELLASDVINFVEEKKINKLNVVMLGDGIQGILRLSDLKINDSTVVKSVVEVSRLIASFLNEISSVVNVEYYHAPTANHSQIRPLGSKASELADEDLEYVIGHYIKDSLISNDRVKVNLVEDGDQYIEMKINGFDIIAGHGHTIKGKNNALQNLSILRGNNYDYAIMGHFHGGNVFTAYEGVANDCEFIIAGSFIGSDPYADSIFKGSKASCLMLGFDCIHGHTETYKFILN